MQYLALGEFTPRSQWRDRSGFAPASYIVVALPANCRTPNAADHRQSPPRAKSTTPVSACLSWIWLSAEDQSLASIAAFSVALGRITAEVRSWSGA